MTWKRSFDNKIINTRKFYPEKNQNESETNERETESRRPERDR